MQVSLVASKWRDLPRRPEMSRQDPKPQRAFKSTSAAEKIGAATPTPSSNPVRDSEGVIRIYPHVANHYKTRFWENEGVADSSFKNFTP